MRGHGSRCNVFPLHRSQCASVCLSSAPYAHGDELILVLPLVGVDTQAHERGGVRRLCALRPLRHHLAGGQHAAPLLDGLEHLRGTGEARAVQGVQ